VWEISQPVSAVSLDEAVDGVRNEWFGPDPQ
jgi:hypothetical protein